MVSNTTTDFECVVVGGGVIGLAVARKLSMDGFDVVLVEKNASFGQETSSRNSGVIHSGIYYDKNSLKKNFCIKGNKLLYEYAKDRNLSFNKCGKLIIAKEKNEESKLLNIKLNAERNGIKLIYKSKSEIKRIEPNLFCYSALFSSESGIIDSHGLMLNFLIDIENNSGKVVFNSKVQSIMPQKNKISFTIDKKHKFTTKILINSAGLNSHILATHIKNYNKKLIPKVKFVKGNYMKLIGKSPFKKLIYPLPTKNGLGIHSTLNIDGQTIFGPDDEEIKTINYEIKKQIKKKFVNSIKQFWPELQEKKIHYDYSGIRTKVARNDFIIQDFGVHGIPGIINLFGIESPGLTSSMIFGNFISNKCKEILKK
tara:strand:+ start:786 stop:1892 length:1107 start_codon:yes stop_codon:yes gene_type:complete